MPSRSLARSFASVLLLVIAVAGGYGCSSSTGAPAGEFACGTAFCVATTEFCYDDMDQCVPAPTCITIPTTCGTEPTCACILGNTTGTDLTCGGDTVDGFNVVAQNHC